MGFWVDDTNAEQHEHEAIEHLEQRLHQRFPAVADSLIDETVETRYHELDENPVREYVPVLVEHATVNDIYEAARTS